MAERKDRYAGAVANYFLDAGKRDGVPLTHLKLQKLVCIGYGFYIAGYDERLFKERIQAWALGPVVPELYHEFKRFGYAPITRKATIFNHQDGKFYTPKVVGPRSRIVLRIVWNLYGALTAFRLVQLTHGPDTPWRNARAKTKDHEIDDADMRGHYRELIRQLARQKARSRSIADH